MTIFRPAHETDLRAVYEVFYPFPRPKAPVIHPWDEGRVPYWGWGGVERTRI